MGNNVQESPSPKSEPRMKKSRASKPKVKTGCQTCKIRRVKCDETKPDCRRCLKFGHQCDGYVPRTTSKPSYPGAPSRTLIPKNQPRTSELPAQAEGSLSPSTPSIHMALSPALFQNEQEYRYFKQFCSQTARELSNCFTKDMWTRSMLQACESSQAIRHAVIAIGALNISNASVQTSEVGTLRHQFAFRQYSKSICLMRRDIAGGRHDLRTTLIASLLFYCFESFHGYHELAISQVYTGLRLIRDWVTSHYKPDAEGKYRVRIGSENPHEVEDDLLRAFGNLEIQVMSYADGRSSDLHEQYRHCGQDDVDEMPVEFGSLVEARTMLELIIRRSMHWLRSTMHLQNFSTEAHDSGGKVREEHYIPLFFDVDPRYEEQHQTMKEYERWDAAFRPLLKEARSPSGSDMFVLASTLRLHWLSGYMMIVSNNCSSSLKNSGRYTRELSELVGLATLLSKPTDANSGKDGAGYVFDLQIVLPLVTVGWLYRHRVLRKEAIELLLRSPRKEGVWDGIVMGKMMAFLSAVEEEGMEPWEQDAEYVPERAATRCIQMSFQTGERKAKISCLQPVRGSRIGEEVKRELIIPW